ncbi:MAG: BON domain-containing protein [Verrucomicrobiales bacterium]|nr:BON domain-containing protein [Verrucomicrobiales bacterium]
MKTEQTRHPLRPAAAAARTLTLMALLTGTPLLLSPALVAGTDMTITDDGISTAVQRHIHQDRGLTGAAIKVQTTQGIVSLSGAVDNLLARDRAVRIADSIRGVRSVVDEITVAPLTRPSGDIQKDIQAALHQDPATASYSVAVSVDDSVATLTGRVGSWAERQLAERIAKGVKGLLLVRNHIEIDYASKRTDQQIADDVKSRLQWDIWLDGDSIKASVSQGKVTLSGSTGSALARTRAFDDAWVDGVTSVDDTHVKVEPGTAGADQRSSSDVHRTDSAIESAIQSALRLDPRVAAFVRDITVRIEDGTVILSGSVGNVAAKDAAEAAARNTVGVEWVDNVLTVSAFVNLPSDSDAERDLRAALRWNPLIDSTTIDAAVVDHVAYLSGRVTSILERVEAQAVASRTKGVKLVRNLLKVEPEVTVSYSDWPSYVSVTSEPKPPKSDEQIKRAIEKAFFWSPFVHRDDITVTVDGGVATLTGTVGSWIGWGEADKDARNSGAAVVLNRLKVR